MKTFDFDFQQIVDAANDVIIVTKSDPIDPPGPEIVYVNKAFTDLTGYAPDEVMGKTPRLLQSSGTDVDTKRAIKQALQKQQPVRVTIRNYAKSGREYWLDVSILPLRDESGEVTHFAAIERDVTEQKNSVRFEKLTGHHGPSFRIGAGIGEKRGEPEMFLLGPAIEWMVVAVGTP